MASIWNDIEITYQDETFTVRPTMELINQVEQGNGRSISSMFMRLVNQDLPSGLACELVARVLQHAGKNVSTEDVYESTGGGLSPELIKTAGAILVGLMPKSSEAAPAKKKRATPKRKR